MASRLTAGHNWASRHRWAKPPGRRPHHRRPTFARANCQGWAASAAAGMVVVISGSRSAPRGLEGRGGEECEITAPMALWLQRAEPSKAVAAMGGRRKAENTAPGEWDRPAKRRSSLGRGIRGSPCWFARVVAGAAVAAVGPKTAPRAAGHSRVFYPPSAPPRRDKTIGRLGRECW